MRTKLKFLLMIWVIPGMAQTLEETITVTGRAEKLVTPNQIEVSIMLQEYISSEGRVSIKTLEEQLITALRNKGLESLVLQIQSLDAHPNYNSYGSDDQLTISKTYLVNMNNIDEFESILNEIEAGGVANAMINNFHFRDKFELTKKLQKSAIENARINAEYVAKIAGKKLGEISTITVFDLTLNSYFGSYSSSIEDSQTVQLRKLLAELSVSVVYKMN